MARRAWWSSITHITPIRRGRYWMVMMRQRLILSIRHTAEIATALRAWGSFYFPAGSKRGRSLRLRRRPLLRDYPPLPAGAGSDLAGRSAPAVRTARSGGQGLYGRPLFPDFATASGYRAPAGHPGPARPCGSTHQSQTTSISRLTLYFPLIAGTLFADFRPAA